MGTYDTSGGQALHDRSHDEAGACDSCGGDPYDCGCEECPDCGAAGDPRCASSKNRALNYASHLLDAHRAEATMRLATDRDWMVRKAWRLREVAGTGCAVAESDAPKGSVNRCADGEG